MDEERNRLVLSHRRALVERKMNRLEVGEVVVGTVRGIKPYGAFIDIGGSVVCCTSPKSVTSTSRRRTRC